MNKNIEVRNLQCIAVLDSVSYGLIYGFLSPYVLELGGSHVSVGILAIGNLAGELLSPDVMSLFTHLHGKRYALFFILNVALVIHLMMVLTDSYWFTILVRILFSITNQSQNLCLNLLLNKADTDDLRNMLQNYYSILNGAGYIIGPVISGYLFDIGFIYIGFLAAFLNFVNINLLMNVSRNENDSNNEHADQSVLGKAIQSIAHSAKDLKECQPGKNWDLLFLKYLFASSIIIFFSKFTQILKYNFNSSSITIGYTSAYINSMVFSSTYWVPIALEKAKNYSLVSITQFSFISIGLLMFAACYAPWYELYVFLLMPIIVLRTVIVNFWKELFSQRKSHPLAKLNCAASVLSGLTIPLLFGIICNQIAHNAVILFSCIPMFLCFAILRWYTRFLDIAQETSDKKDS